MTTNIDARRVSGITFHRSSARVGVAPMPLARVGIASVDNMQDQDLAEEVAAIRRAARERLATEQWAGFALTPGSRLQHQSAGRVSGLKAEGMDRLMRVHGDSQSTSSLGQLQHDRAAQEQPDRRGAGRDFETESQHLVSLLHMSTRLDSDHINYAAGSSSSGGRGKGIRRTNDYICPTALLSSSSGATDALLGGGDVPVTPAEVDAVRMAARDLLGVSDGRPCGWPNSFPETNNSMMRSETNLHNRGGRASSAMYPRRLPSTREPLSWNYKTGQLERQLVDSNGL